jgi:hypothetical protein
MLGIILNWTPVIYHTASHIIFLHKKEITFKLLHISVFAAVSNEQVRNSRYLK